jgi:simple sugar transport system ATP-binding protein
LATYALVKRFGSLTALDQVSLEVAAGSVHALLGENGAGKSTLVKCVAGVQTPDEGSVLVDGREQSIANPFVARALGIGMVYQHFTVAPGMTVAENLLLAAGVPAVIDWPRQRQALRAFMESTPFQLDLDARPGELAAGERQKLELLKQLYLRPRLLILDEPTSVLTPNEADQVLGAVRAIAQRGECTVLLITHKFREVMAFADAVTVLRQGRAVYHTAVGQTQEAVLAQAMVGPGASKAAALEALEVPLDVPEPPELLDALAAAPSVPSLVAPEAGAAPQGTGAPPALQVRALQAMGDRGTVAVHGVSLSVHAGEIVGIAGVAGNGQRELVEALVGQRARLGGEVLVGGQPYHGHRSENTRLRVRSLPDEPLRNACVGTLSVAENMALRDFDRAPMCRAGLLNLRYWRERARAWVRDYGIKTQGVGAPMRSLSGGNVQRAVLARELAGTIDVLIASNPVFGLDFAAVAEIHERLRRVRDQGGAVLLVSADLDELLALSDRIVVMSDGRLVYETPAASADRHQLGSTMGGGPADGAPSRSPPP